MIWLLFGCLIFYGVHLVSASPLKAPAQQRLGANGYKGLYSLVSIVGLALMVWGYGQAAGGRALWAAPPALIPLSIALSVAGLFSVIGGNLPSNWRRFFRHPMSLGIVVFSVGHLLVNSTPRDLVLFGSLAAYSLFNIWSASRRGPWVRKPKQPLWTDALHVGVWIVAVIALYFWLHGLLFGVDLG